MTQAATSLKPMTLMQLLDAVATYALLHPEQREWEVWTEASDLDGPVVTIREGYCHGTLLIARQHCLPSGVFEEHR